MMTTPPEPLIRCRSLTKQFHKGATVVTPLKSLDAAEPHGRN